MTEAQELREAARLMRGRAQAASGGNWVAGGIGDYGWSVSADLPFPAPQGVLSIETHDSEQGRADAEYIASWYPPVALVIADLLDAQARQLELSDGLHCFTDDPNAVAEALRIARAYLRSQP